MCRRYGCYIVHFTTAIFLIVSTGTKLGLDYTVGVDDFDDLTLLIWSGINLGLGLLSLCCILYECLRTRARYRSEYSTWDNELENK